MELALPQTLAISSERGLNKPLGSALMYVITFGSAGDGDGEGVGLACQSPGDVGVLFDYILIDLVHVVFVAFELDGRGLDSAVNDC